jgi:L-alanine-DL-glutamate epimerase-like enolase superfamily enzyme
MHLHHQTFTVRKRFALRISRGTTDRTTNVWVRLEQDGIEGWGEASPFEGGKQPQTTEAILTALDRLRSPLEPVSLWEHQRMDDILAVEPVPSAVRTAIDIARQDWLGKKVGLPLWKLWGLDRDRIPATSVTIGISSPAAACDRLRAWQDVLNPTVLKVKLGNPDGVAADRAMLTALLEVAPADRQIYVDANGGWSVEDAIGMSHWLADRGIEYIEQPLPLGDAAAYAKLYAQSPLPIFVDESCWTSRDIPPLAHCVHGVNIKLMKCGLAEALRAIHTARACGLKTMLGCYSDSTLANTAAAHLSPLVDYVDLDSHLNLMDDPFTGAVLQAGRVRPNDLPGLGVGHHADCA